MLASEDEPTAFDMDNLQIILYEHDVELLDDFHDHFTSRLRNTFDTFEYSIDPINHCLYYILPKGMFIVYDYKTRRVVRNFKLDIGLSNSFKTCRKVTECGSLYLLANTYGSPSVCYKYNVYTNEVKALDQTHDVMTYFYMNMLEHEGSLYFYGNVFKSSTSQLVEYKLNENTINSVCTFTDDGNDSFNYEYPDPNFLTIYKNNCIGIGSTCFSYQAFSSGILDRDLWVFSENGHKRIRTIHGDCFGAGVEPFATCFVPFGDFMAGIIFSGYDENNDVIVNKVGLLVLPLDSLNSLSSELEWKTFDLPPEMTGKITGRCVCELIEHIPDKFYRLLIMHQGEVYELDLIFNKLCIYNSAKNVKLDHKTTSFMDVTFKF